MKDGLHVTALILISIKQELQGLIKSIRISGDPNIQTYGDFRFPRMQLMEDLLNWICKVYKIQ